MEFTHYLGVDISKKTLDLSLLSSEEEIFSDVIANDTSVIKHCLSNLISDFSLSLDSFLVCAEYTGMYSRCIALACAQLGINLWFENPSEIKLSSGVQRNKNDKLDASRIAKYAIRFSDRARLYSIPDEDIERIKLLLSERDMLVADRAKYKGQLKDQKDYMPAEVYKSKARRLNALIRSISKAIDIIEKDIDDTILNNDLMYKQYGLLTSVDGVGQQLALKTIVETRCFTRFTDPRKFSCHAGVVPFDFTSGSSQRSRSKVSNRARKDIKRLLHMGALAAIKKNGELKDYYDRKVNEGKNKMLVINAVRAKIVLRMFSVIKREETYIKSYLPIA